MKQNWIKKIHFNNKANSQILPFNNNRQGNTTLHNCWFHCNIHASSLQLTLLLWMGVLYLWYLYHKSDDSHHHMIEWWWPTFTFMRWHIIYIYIYISISKPGVIVEPTTSWLNCSLTPRWPKRVCWKKNGIKKEAAKIYIDWIVKMW